MYWWCFVTALINKTFTNALLLSSVYGKEAQGISLVGDKKPKHISGLTEAMCFYSGHAPKKDQVSCVLA